MNRAWITALALLAAIVPGRRSLAGIIIGVVVSGIAALPEFAGAPRELLATVVSRANDCHY